MRVAVVHDWLYTFGGAERVLQSMMRCLPAADVFALFDILPTIDRARISPTQSRTSFLQHMPGIRRYHRLYLPLMPLAVEQFDLSGYDLVVSSSYAVAKGVLTGPDQLHLAYVHSPMRYAWDLQHQYLTESRLTSGPKSLLARLLLHRMRLWDTRTANGVDAYMVNSHFVGRRVRKIYGRDAKVIHPPVGVPDKPPPARVKENFFLTASRLVSYKNVHAVVEAFRNMPDQKLVVAGRGPELKRLQSMAGPNVKFAGFVPDAELRRLMGSARAFIFAAEEDFGITPLEAQSEGTPVLALARGGVRETIRGDGAAPTGVLFDFPTPAAIEQALRTFVERENMFDPGECYQNARRFRTERFEAEFSAFVSEQADAFQSKLQSGFSKSELGQRGILEAAE
jgi:glycosyltransferase involved in cell wall biosynthesis